MAISVKNLCFNLLYSVHPFLPPDQQAHALRQLAKHLYSRDINYNEYYNDKGSMTDASHTKVSAVTDVVVQTMTRCIPLTKSELSQMSEEQVVAYLDRWVRRSCYNTQWRNGHMNGSYTRRSNEDSPSYARQHTPTEYRDNKGNIQSCPLMAQYNPTLEQEEEQALIEVFDKMKIATLHTALKQPALLFSFPKITLEALLKYLMYKSGEALRGQQTISSSYLILLDRWWRISGYDRSIYNRWLLELPNLQTTLNSLSGKWSKHIKEAILAAHSLSDTEKNRETLRRSLNHATKGVHFLNLTIWLTLCSPADEYQDEFLNLTSTLIKPAGQVLSKKEENRTFSAKAKYEHTASLVHPNTLIRKGDLRPLLSKFQHDQDFNELSPIKANSIRRLVDHAFTLSEEVGQHFNTTPLKNFAPIKWRR